MSVIRSVFRPFYRFAHGLVVAFCKIIGVASVRLGGPLWFYTVWEKPYQVNLIMVGQHARPSPPNCLRVRCGYQQHDRQPWPIFWQRIAPARLVGESLAVLNKRKLVMLEGVYDKQHGMRDPSFTYLKLPPSLRLGGAWTSTVSRWCPATSTSYYHWLTDALPRLALLDQFPEHTGILTVASLTPFQRDTLEILNVLDRVRPTPETHLVVDEYYHSSFTSMTGCDNPYALRFLRQRFLPAASESAPRPEKIYISRLGSARSARREEQMIEILQHEGWTIIETQNYSFREQVALFSEARAVCAIHGAGLTNLAWCPRDCKVLELCPSNFLNGCYEGMATYLDLDYRYMVFPADSRYRMNVDLEQFTATIREMD